MLYPTELRERLTDGGHVNTRVFGHKVGDAAGVGFVNELGHRAKAGLW